MTTYNHEQAVRELMGLEYQDYVLSEAPSNLRGLQVPLEDGVEQEGGDIFYDLAVAEINSGYWEDSTVEPDRLDQCAIYNVMKTDRWYPYTPQSTGHTGIQLESSYACTAQGSYKGHSATSDISAGLHHEAYHRAQSRLRRERAIFGIEDIIKGKPVGRSKARRIARELRADNRRLARIANGVAPLL